MTDVRLTATNPEDSSVVPVACNSRGELLVTEPVIEQINNDVEIDGVITAHQLNTTGPDEGQYQLGTDTRFLFCKPFGAAGATFYMGFDGSSRWKISSNGSSVGTLWAGTTNYALEVQGSGGVQRWYVDWSGNQIARDVVIAVEPDDAANWQPTEGNDEEAVGYTGPAISVRDELVFLRAQVRALMEKLKMSPEGGWPVWDGSD